LADGDTGDVDIDEDHVIAADDDEAEYSRDFYSSDEDEIIRQEFITDDSSHNWNYGESIHTIASIINKTRSSDDCI